MPNRFSITYHWYGYRPLSIRNSDNLTHGKELQKSERNTALILLHPFPYDARAWDEVVELLPGITVVCPNLPGCGSSVAWEKLGFEQVSDDIVAYIRGSGIDQVVVAGESMGGYIALAIVERHPEFVCGLALVDTKATAEPEEGKQTREQIAVAALDEGPKVVADTWKKMVSPYTLHNNPGVLRKMRAQIAGARSEGIAWCQRSIAQRTDRSTVIQNFSKPVLLLQGRDDPNSSPEQFAQICELVQNPTVVLLENTGHLPNFEAPQELAKALQALFAEACR